MFSAIYLVCFIGEPCKTFADPAIYPSYEVCVQEAEANIMKNMINIEARGIPLPDVEYQCLTWDKA